MVAFLNGIVTTLSKGEDFAKVAVQIVHEPDDVVLSADRALLERVVINLLVNAVHAVGGDGAVTVSVRKDGDQCEIVFRDNGPGFPEGAEDKVFEPFFTTKSRGTGLGLAICQQVVSLHGGTITAESDATSGAVLTVRLPMESGDPSTPLRSSFYASQKDSQEDPEEGGATRKGQSLTTAAGAGNQSR